MKAPAAPQLDLFADSRDVMLRNDAIDAVLQRDEAAATLARRALAAEDAQHTTLPALDVLISALGAPAGPAFEHRAAAAAARQHLARTIAPAAQSLLGADAAPWLTPFWRALAQRAERVPYAAEHPTDHAAALWLQAGEPACAARAVGQIPSWRRIPQPLAWMVRARHATEGLDAVWPLLAELAWLAPTQLNSCALALADPLLTRLLSRFDADVEADATTPLDKPLAWFPAWLVNDKPALLPQLRLAQAGQSSAAEQGLRLMVELLGLERQGRHAELVVLRKRLRDLQPGLYASHMRTR